MYGFKILEIMRKYLLHWLFFHWCFANATSTRKILFSDIDCEEQVYNTVTQAINSELFSLEEIEWISQAALAIYCYGYTLDEVIGAQR